VECFNRQRFHLEDLSVLCGSTVLLQNPAPGFEMAVCVACKVSAHECFKSSSAKLFVCTA
jgi:hypothetical protein